MHTSCAANNYPTNNMDETQKKDLALKVIKNENGVSELASNNQVSRKFIYTQKAKATKAIDDAFDPKPKDIEKEKVLFYLPVTKSWICQFILVMILNCRGSYRGVIKSLSDLLDYQISIGKIHNVVHEHIQKSIIINSKQDLSNVKIGAHDELFHQNKPMLAGIDIPSLYCYLLTQEAHRDADTWGIHVLDLVKQNFNPERVIADDGSGLRAGLKEACPNIPCDGDTFHLLQLLIDLRRYFRNRLKSRVSYLKKIQDRMDKAKLKGKAHKLSRKLGVAKKDEANFKYYSANIDTLVSWMHHDVLKMPGSNPTIRYEMYNFILQEFKNLAERHSHRIKEVCITLENQREQILAFVKVLDCKFTVISTKYKCSKNHLWELCELQRYNKNNNAYYTKSKNIRKILKDQFYILEAEIIEALNSTESSSSLVENLNSRVRTYSTLRKEIGSSYLSLLQFYFNYSKFLRSAKPEREGKSPVEILTDKAQPHWLEMLGFDLFKRSANH